jgi:hypothetical protein
MSALCRKRTSWLSATCANYFRPVHLPRPDEAAKLFEIPFRAGCLQMPSVDPMGLDDRFTN